MTTLQIPDFIDDYGCDASTGKPVTARVLDACGKMTELY